MEERMTNYIIEILLISKIMFMFYGKEFLSWWWIIGIWSGLIVVEKTVEELVQQIARKRRRE